MQPKVMQKAIAILELVCVSSKPVDLGMVIRFSGVPKSTAHRILKTFTEYGLVEHVKQGYVMGEKWRALCCRSSLISMVENAKPVLTPHLIELHNRTGGAAVAISILRGTKVAYLDTLHLHRHLHIIKRIVGNDVPLHCAAAGKALLAHRLDVTEDALECLEAFTDTTVTDPLKLRAELNVALRNGVAYSREEYLVGVSSVAAPIIFPKQTRPSAAISVIDSTERIDLFVCALLVRQAAKKISTELAAARWPA
ncbi:IclR family transcriptional regulator [Saccharopolyspora terrae]|uniref:IclR family transcriptional regulator n=1 Tax=Saccharopolyspora terrae TaxID=2530384 RepID=UPI00140440B7|nr:IclR family transcriptional regulator C-terminal domain-containing protein [Saccharopolyspora terrae]